MRPLLLPTTLLALTTATTHADLTLLGPGNAHHLSVPDKDESRRAASNLNLTAFTIEAWINLQDLTVNSFGRAGGIVAYGTATRSPYALWAHAGSPSNPITETRLAIQVNWNTSNNLFFASDEFIPVNQWTHVAATYDGSTTLRLFMDGDLIKETTYTHPLGQLGSGTLSVGNNFHGVVEHFGGELDELRIWDHARTEQEIAADMNRRVCPDAPGLWAYWNFDEPAGAQTIIDRSGNNRDLLLGTSSAAQTNDPAQIASTAPVIDTDINTDGIPDTCQAPSPCPGDVDSDGDTDVFDFADLASNFGAGPGATRAMGDLTSDGLVDVFDFAELASDFGCAP